MARKPFLGNVLATQRISQDTWTAVYILLGAGAILVAGGIWGTLNWYGWVRWFGPIDIIVGGVLILLGGYIIVVGLMDIPADPPHVGLLTVWGERVPVLLSEGLALLPNFWPFNVGAIVVSVEKKNFDFEFTDVRCRNATDADGKPVTDPSAPTAGGAVTVKVSVTLSPDYTAIDRDGNPCGAKRVMGYLNHGRMDGVRSILDDTLSEATRHLAGLYDWETFMFMKAPLAVALLAKISDIDFKRLPRKESNGDFSENVNDITPERYAKFEEIELAPLEYLFGDDLKALEPAERKKEQQRRLVEIEIFLKLARQSGVSDIIDLGVHIARLNVSHIVPEGDLAKDAEGAAREKKQREAETFDIDTGILLAQKYLDFAKDGSVTAAEALQLTRIDRKRATEQVIRTPASTDPLTRSAAIVASGR